MVSKLKSGDSVGKPVIARRMSSPDRRREAQNTGCTQGRPSGASMTAAFRAGRGGCTPLSHPAYRAVLLRRDSYTTGCRSAYPADASFPVKTAAPSAF